MKPVCGVRKLLVPGALVLVLLSAAPGALAGESPAAAVVPAAELSVQAPTAPTPPAEPAPLEIKLGDDAKAPRISASLGIIGLMTLLTLLPAMLVMTTSFTRIIIVLGFLRHALSTQTIPPNMVLMGLSLFLTLFIMSPVIQRVQTEAVTPYMDGKMDAKTAIEKGLVPLREFMGRQTREKDLGLMLELSHAGQPASFEDVPTLTLIPAFILSELRTAFQMGFLLFLPFLIIDLVVSAVLMALGMMMVPPAMITLPLKLLLFVIADGWHLVIKSLVASFGVAG